jgi:hypothetical protein
MRIINEVILITFSILPCFNSFAQKPGSIEEAITYFEHHWPAKEKEKFKLKPERQAVMELHFSVGMWIRNEWIRGNRDTALLHQFLALDIHHPDDMSGIILTCLHRKLNNRPLDIEGMAKASVDGWKPILEYNKKTRLKAVENYKKFTIGDTIHIYMTVDTSSGQRNAVLIEDPKSDWIFYPEKDLSIQAIVTDKYFLTDSSNVFFRAKIVAMNFENTKILMKEVKTNGTYDFHLDKLRIE